MSRPTKRLSAMCVAAGLVLTLGACDSTSPSSSSLSLQLTDSPGDLSKAWVQITEIRLQGQSEAGPGGVTLLSEPTEMIELTQLANRTEELVADVEVASGTYAQLRIHIGAAAVETDGGDLFSMNGAAANLNQSSDGSLICPSCTQTGIKVDLPGGALQLESESKILMLDFDVTQSFGREAGTSGSWVMNPLIRTSEVQATATVSGEVSLAEGENVPSCGGEGRSVADFVPVLLDAGDPAASGDVSTDGSYSIDFLEPGTYGVDYEGEIDFDNGDVLSFTASAGKDQVDVESGGEATVDYTISGASCQNSS